MSSSNPQPPSAGAGNSAAPLLRPAPLLTAGVMLAERGIYGMVWIDDDLMVSAKYGRLVDFVDVGEPIASQLVPLVGLEDEIRALKGKRGAIVELPAVSIIGPRGASPKVSIAAYWSDEEQCYLVVLTRYSSRSDLEVELSRQIRARLIAEAEVTHKSRELARTNAELARANRDLEEFASIISHDLKAPMRLLRYLVDDLEASLGGTDRKAATEKLADVKGQSRRMSEMLSALLEYSSAGRKDEIAEEVDTLGLVQAIVRSQRPPAGFDVEIAGYWPRIVTLAAPLDLVLRNLVDNAIKHHDRATGRVRIVGAEAGQSLVIRVEDDGPGIPAAAHGAVFLPFRRLSGESGVEGQGMGLAFVQRWVEAAGARLVLESNPEVRRGSAFELTWPRVHHKSSEV